MNSEYTDFGGAAALPSIFEAWWFDGARAEARAARLRLEGGDLVVESAEGAFITRRPLSAATISKPFAHAPRQLCYSDGASLQIDAHRGEFAAALDAHGYRLDWASRLERLWPGVLGALAVLLVALYFGYTLGLPAASRWVASHLPESVERRIGDQVLASFEGRYLAPSDLDEDLRRSIADRFAAAAHAVAPGVAYRLEFRSTVKGGRSGINAFALPGGTIVLLDGLVDFAEYDEDQIVAVLGHELGHVVHHHGMRNVLSAMSVGAVAGLLWGDFSGIAAQAGVIVGVLDYSREAEREADLFAVQFLHANGQSVQPLYDFLIRVQDELEEGRGDMPNFLASHPATSERLDALAQELANDEPEVDPDADRLPEAAPDPGADGVPRAGAEDDPGAAPEPAGEPAPRSSVPLD